MNIPTLQLQALIMYVEVYINVINLSMGYMYMMGEWVIQVQIQVQRFELSVEEHIFASAIL
jgi:hypothetical protein